MLKKIKLSIMLFRLESKHKWKNLKGREKFKMGILCRWGGGGVV